LHCRLLVTDSISIIIVSWVLFTELANRPPPLHSSPSCRENQFPLYVGGKVENGKWGENDAVNLREK